MHPSPEELAKSYAAMDERELVQVARSYDSLTAAAQGILRAEFGKRDLELPIIDDLEAPRATARNLITLRRYRDLSEAIVARSLLESAGIPVYLRDENLVRLEWQISNLVGGIRLQVEAGDRNEADAVLSQPVPDTVRFGEEAEFIQPHCPRCDSKEISFEGSSRGPALASLYFLSLPLPLGRQTWLCNSCEARWQEDDSPSGERENT